MTKPLLTLLLLVSTLHTLAFAQEAKSHPFEISGKLNGRENGILKLSYINEVLKNCIDTAEVKNGNFTFKGTMSQVHQASLRGNITSNSIDDPNLLSFFLEPGSISIKLTEGDFKKAEIMGSPLNAEMQQLKLTKTAISNTQKAIGLERDKINTQAAGGKLSAELSKKRADLQAAYIASRNKEKLVDYAYIIQHSNSQLSPWLMNYYFESRKLPLDSAELFYNAFTAPVKESFFGRNINQLIVSRKASAVGSIAPGFERTDKDAVPISLAQFKNKQYVLLDFWASWCVPCREENPRLKKIYNSYQDKGLEIISISWDNKADLWRAAIEADGTGKWRHIFASMYEPNDLSMRDKYAIASIPSLVLIDKKGTIIGRFRGAAGEGSMDDLEKMLESRL